MNKHIFLSIGLLALLIAIPLMTHAATFLSLNRSFGGKVIATSVPSVTCSGSGTGPITLTKTSTFQYYADSESKSPQVDDWILGTTSYIPDFTTCKIKIGQYEIPYPVNKTTNYNISSNNGFSSGFSY
jgi:hypothetical protein